VEISEILSSQRRGDEGVMVGRAESTVVGEWVRVERS